MKIQNLAVIFIVIILPISLVISTYTKYQVQTVSLQSSYDSKLLNATYDAVKAYQLNAASSGTTDIANSKLRDIEASANTFYNSVSSNFDMKGFNQDVLKEYVPTLVYTMYDGMYLYSSYTNEFNDITNGEVNVDETLESKYKDGERIYGLRPYIFYSCRYVKGTLDVVITYSLDNYISIQGNSNGEPINVQGYVLSNVNINGDQATYRGVNITTENNIKQYYYNNGTIPGSPGVNGIVSANCRKVDGVRYYQEGSTVFTFLNNTYLQQNNGLDVVNNKNAVLYYQEAKNLEDTMRDLGIDQLTPGDAVAADGSKPFGNDTTQIFEGLGAGVQPDVTSIEEPNSNFNQHRLQVIRNTVEKNLSTAIANYNNSLGTYEFKMPKLKEDDWEKILNNIAVISFLQGVNIGGKIYNGYAIVPNNENEDVVTESSIYIIGNDGYYHAVTDEDLVGNIDNNTARGVLNADFEVHSIVGSDSVTTQYYIPKGSGGSSIEEGANEYGSYNSIITSTKISKDYDGNMYKYIDSKGGNLAKIYYTALARERYGTYKGARFKVDFTN